MNLNFGEFKHLDVSLLAILQVLNFNLSKFEPFTKYQIYPNSKLRVFKIAKMVLFEILILPKLISRQIDWQINSCIADLNLTFRKFLEHSVVEFILQKIKAEEFPKKISI